MATDDLQHDQRVIAFVDAARQFCTLIESHRASDRETFVRRCAVLLTRLYVAGVGLLDVPLEQPVSCDQARMTHDDWNAVFHDLQETFGEGDGYWLVFDPYNRDDASCTSISDDLADIYRDVKAGLVAFGRSEEDSKNAIAGWRFQFLAHWGHHATSALRPIHKMIKRLAETLDR